MISKTTLSKKHWHHTRDLQCPNCELLTVFVIDNETDDKLCTECYTTIKNEEL